MKHKDFLIIPLLLSAVMSRAEIVLQIEQLNGAEQTMAIASIGTIMFHQNSIYLYDKNNVELGNTPINNVNKISFKNDGNTMSVDNIPSKTISIYPNPAMETLMVVGLAKDQTIRVYSLEGVLLTVTQSHDGQAVVPVGDLAQGWYLLQVGAEVVKFVKH